MKFFCGFFIPICRDFSCGETVEKAVVNAADAKGNVKGRWGKN